MKGPKIVKVIENKPIAKGVYSLKLFHPGLCERVCRGRFFHIK